MTFLILIDTCLKIVLIMNSKLASMSIVHMYSVSLKLAMNTMPELRTA